MTGNPYTLAPELVGKIAAVALILLAIAGGVYYVRWSGEDAQVQRTNAATDRAAADAAVGVEGAQSKSRAAADAAVSDKVATEGKRREKTDTEQARLQASDSGKGMAERYIPEETEAWMRQRAGERREVSGLRGGGVAVGGGKG